MRSFRHDAHQCHVLARATSDPSRASVCIASSASQPRPFRQSAVSVSSPSTMHQTQSPDGFSSISPGVVYSTAHAVWSAQELQILQKGLAEYPAETYDNVTRYIKIAAMIPGKCVRDVAFRVKAQALEAESSGREALAKRMRIDHTAELLNMANQQPLEDAQLNALFHDNVLAISTIRNNLLNGKAGENKDVMVKFRDNCQTLMSAIGSICNTLPPLPIKLDTSLITSDNSGL